jgi:hypothetical protein
LFAALAPAAAGGTDSTDLTSRLRRDIVWSGTTAAVKSA